MKFKNIGGIHEQDGKIYKRGDIINTAKPLDKMFKNHFVRVDRFVGDEASATEVAPQDLAGLEAAAERATAAVAKERERLEAKGEAEVEAEAPAMSPAELQEAANAEVAEAEAKAKEEAAAADEDEDEDEDEEDEDEEDDEDDEDEEEDDEDDEDDFGEDVTANYKKAKKAGVKVYEKDHWFVLVDTDDDKQVGKKLRKKQVKAAIADMIED